MREGYMLPSPQLQQYLQSNEEEPITPQAIKITSQGESPTFGLLTSLPVTLLSVTSLSVTSHPLAMLLSVMSNDTFCITTIVRKKSEDALPSEHALQIQILSSISG
jgi:hypothetical protein